MNAGGAERDPGERSATVASGARARQGGSATGPALSCQTHDGGLEEFDRVVGKFGAAKTVQS
jgi:hypothetical protein